MDTKNESIAKEKTNSITITDPNAQNGAVRISNTAILAIIKKYLLGIDGVVRLAPKTLKEGLSGLFSRHSSDSNISIEMTEEGKIIINLSVVLCFGDIIPEVTRKIQDVLFAKIPELTSCRVEKINIEVVDLEEPQEESAKKTDENSLELDA